MIYLATPYSHPDPAVRESRFHLACLIAGRMMANGELVFCPIAHSHPIAEKAELPKGFEYWERFDRTMIRACSKVVICKMEGWTESVGIAAEIRIAEELHKPVEFIEV